MKDEGFFMYIMVFIYYEIDTGSVRGVFGYPFPCFNVLNYSACYIGNLISMCIIRIVFNLYGVESQVNSG